MLKEIKYYTIIFFLGFISLSKADVGETYDLKYKRQLLLQNLNNNDSSLQDLSKEELISSIHNYKALLELDNKIFSSYQSTVHRTAYYEYEQKVNNRALIIIAFMVSLLIVGALVLIYRQSRLLKAYTNNSYSLLSFIKEIAVLSLPLFQSNAKAYQINKLLYISILVMAVFVFIGLLSQL